MTSRLLQDRVSQSLSHSLWQLVKCPSSPAELLLLPKDAARSRPRCVLPSGSIQLPALVLICVLVWIVLRCGPAEVGKIRTCSSKRVACLNVNLRFVTKSRAVIHIYCYSKQVCLCVRVIALVCQQLWALLLADPAVTCVMLVLPTEQDTQL